MGHTSLDGARLTAEKELSPYHKVRNPVALEVVYDP